MLKPLHGLLAAVSTLIALPAAANDTAIHMGRYGPGPVGGPYTGRESAVAMVREHLAITLGRKQTRVVARFTFRNSLPTPTTQLVGFPDEALARQHRDPKVEDLAESPMVGPLRRLTTRVDGVVRASKPLYGQVKWRADNLGWEVASGPSATMPMAWHTLSVAFPPGQDVVVERRYETEHGWNALPSKFFEYITHTGGPWQGPIGELVADVTLAEGLTVDGLIWPGHKFAGYASDADTSTSPARASWRVKDPHHMQLVWQNFEPRTQRGRQGFKLVMP